MRLNKMEGECVDPVGPPFCRPLRVYRDRSDRRERVGLEMCGQFLGSYGSQIDGRGTLADTAFLVQNSDNFSHGGEDLGVLGPRLRPTPGTGRVLLTV